MVHSIHDSTVMAVQRPDGWYVGAAGPFEKVHAATVTTDANCVIVRAWQPGGQGEPHEFFVTKKSVHGPFTGTTPVKDFYEGAYLVQKANEEGNEFRPYLFLHDTLHGPFQVIEAGCTDAAGTRYLFCRMDTKGHDRFHVFTKKGLIGIYDDIQSPNGTALIARPSSTTDAMDVIFGGRVLHHHHSAISITAHTVGRNLLQHVRHKDAKHGVSETLILNAVEIAGPYDSISSLSVTEEGKLTYNAIETDHLGNRSLHHYKGTLPTDL